MFYGHLCAQGRLKDKIQQKPELKLNPDIFCVTNSLLKINDKPF